jgi:molybdenum cofactor cytidylyltransferase
MSRAPGFCAVILAAGESTRMGRDKALLPWPPGAAEPSGTTFLSAAIESLQDFNDSVIVVAGKNENFLAAPVYAAGATMVINPAPERGQFSSMQVGLQEVLNCGRDAAMVTLVDRPPLMNTTVQALREEFNQVLARAKWGVIPEHNGRHGHPILIGREMIEAFLKASPSATARDVEHQFRSQIEYFPVNDANVTLNVNTPEDYAALRSGR